jgi:hypothetical protein
MLAEHAARTSLNMHAIWYVIFVNGLIIGLPNPAWASLENVVFRMAHAPLKEFFENLRSPNEDFGRRSQPFTFRMRFPGEAPFINSGNAFGNGWLRLPKSSFWEG